MHINGDMVRYIYIYACVFRHISLPHWQASPRPKVYVMHVYMTHWILCCFICSQQAYRGITCLHAFLYLLTFNSRSLFYYLLHDFPFHLSAHPSVHCIWSLHTASLLRTSFQNFIERVCASIVAMIYVFILLIHLFIWIYLLHSGYLFASRHHEIYCSKLLDRFCTVTLTSTHTTWRKSCAMATCFVPLSCDRIADSQNMMLDRRCDT